MARADIDPTSLQAGTRIHAYEVVSKLGQGGMGAVYKVVRDGKTYALKMTAQSASEATPEQRAHADARTRREVATLAAISHPNVVQIRAFDRWPDSEEGYLYLVTDLVEGDRLYTWQRKHKPSLRHLCGVFLHIADALYELHRHEVFHRDLKHENVLVRNDGEPILIDFGIARQRSAYTLTSAGTIVGTSTHLSPEFCRFVTSAQGARGERYTFRPTDDLHAVGYMLYEMLTGRPPFALVDDNEWDLLIDIANRLPAPPREANPGVPVALDSLVMRLLAKDAAQRFQTAKELADAFTGLLEQAGQDWDQPFELPALQQRPAFDAKGRSRSRQPAAGAELSALLFDEDGSGVRHAQSPPAVPSPPADSAPAKPTPPTRPVASAPPVPRPAQDFRPPTETRQAFQPALQDEAAAAPAPDARPGLPTSLRIASTQLAAREGRPSRATLLAALGGAGAMGLIAFLVLGGRAADTARPQSLLSNYDKARHDAASAPPQKPSPPPETTTPPPETVSAATRPAQPVPGAEAPVAPVPAKAQAAAVPKPASNQPVRVAKADAQPASSQPAQVQTASWLKTAESIEQPKPAAVQESARLGVPFGAHIRVKLKSTLDSRSAQDALVEAVLHRPLLIRGEPLLPSRTMIYGTAQASNGRFVIRFTRLRLPDDREVAFKGAALDTADGKAGLAPTRRTGAAPSGGDDLPGKVLKASANLVLGKVGGDTASDVASSAGQTVLNHRDTAPSAVEQALLLDAGTDFDIVVQEAF